MSAFIPDPHGETPPILPPKPGSHETSRIGTPATARAATQPPLRPGGDHGQTPGPGAGSHEAISFSAPVPDPGDMWLPQVLQDKSKQDLAQILSTPSLLTSLTHSPSSIHPSLQSSHSTLHAALSENLDLASQLLELESRLAHQRSATQAQLLSTHTLERQWRQKQSDMDHALAPFSPASLYQQLGQGVQEQTLVCQAMEESFLEGGGEGEGVVSEREAAEWVRRYREAKVLNYLRLERKERWDEGRVGGWR